MATSFTDLIEQARQATRALVEFGEGLLSPTVRLGVTGLSRAGKTVFITALVHGLVRGGRFPVFEALASGRVASARLAPQPDDAVPRFRRAAQRRDSEQRGADQKEMNERIFDELRHRYPRL